MEISSWSIYWGATSWMKNATTASSWISTTSSTSNTVGPHRAAPTHRQMVRTIAVCLIPTSIGDCRGCFEPRIHTSFEYHAAHGTAGAPLSRNHSGCLDVDVVPVGHRVDVCSLPHTEPVAAPFGVDAHRLGGLL